MNDTHEVYQTRIIQRNPYLYTVVKLEYQKQRDRKAARDLRQITYRGKTIRPAANVNSNHRKRTKRR